MDPPDWAVYNQASEFYRDDHAFFQLGQAVPFEDAMKHVINIDSATTTTKRKITQVFGQSNNFSKVDEIVKKLNLNIEQSILMTEIKVTVDKPEEVTRLFDIFLKVWSGYFETHLPAMPTNSPIQDFMNGPPSLKHLAGVKLMQSGKVTKVQDLPVPANLHWFLEGIKMCQKADESWSEQLDCRRKAAFRDFSIKAEVGGVLPLGTPDEHTVLNEPLLPFYDIETQRSWRTSYAIFRPSPHNSFFSYDMKVPNSHHATNTRDLAKDLQQAINSKDMHAMDDGYRWTFSSGSSGGTFTNHDSNQYNITNGGNFNWKSIVEARAGFTRFAEIVKTKPWENDKTVVTLVVRGGSCAELDLCASEIIEIISAHTATGTNNIDIKCWFSTLFTDKTNNYPTLTTLHECAQQLEECQFVMDVECFLKPISDKAREELGKRFAPLRDPTPEQQAPEPVKSPKKQNFFQKLFSKEKTPTMKPRRRTGNPSWEVAAVGKFYGAIKVIKYACAPEVKNNTELKLGCKACWSALAYRDNGYENRPCMMECFCPVHRTLYLAAHENNTLGFNLGPRTLAAASSTIPQHSENFDRAPEDSISLGLVSPKKFAKLLDGLHCGKIESHIWTWREKNINQILERQ